MTYIVEKKIQSIYNSGRVYVWNQILVTIKNNTLIFTDLGEFKIQRIVKFSNPIKDFCKKDENLFFVLTEGNLYEYNFAGNNSLVIMKIKGEKIEIIDDEAFILTNKFIKLFNYKKEKNYNINLKFNPQNFVLSQSNIFISDFEGKVYKFDFKGKILEEKTISEEIIEKMVFCEASNNLFCLSRSQIFEFNNQTKIFSVEKNINDISIFNGNIVASLEDNVIDIKNNVVVLDIKNVLLLELPYLIIDKNFSIILLKNMEIYNKIINVDEITDMIYDELEECVYISGSTEYLSKCSIKNELLIGKNFEGHSDSIMSISKHDNTIITASRDSSVILRNKDAICQIKSHTGPINSCDINSEIFVTVSKDLTMQIFKYRIPNLPKEENEIKKIKIQEIETENIYTRKIHEKEINCVKIFNNYIVTAGQDKKVHIFDLKGNKIETFSDHKKSVWCVDLNNKILVSGSADLTLKVYDLNSMSFLKTLEGHKSAILKVLVRDNKIYSSDSDGVIKIWETSNFNCIFSESISDERVWSICSFGDNVAFGDADGEILVLKDNILEIKKERKEEEKQKIELEQKFIQFNKNKMFIDSLGLLIDSSKNFNEIYRFFEENFKFFKDNEQETFRVFEIKKMKFFEILKNWIKKMKNIEITSFLINGATERNWNVQEFSKELEKQFEYIESLYLKIKGSEIIFK